MGKSGAQAGQKRIGAFGLGHIGQGQGPVVIPFQIANIIALKQGGDAVIKMGLDLIVDDYITMGDGALFDFSDDPMAVEAWFFRKGDAPASYGISNIIGQAAAD